MGSVRLFDVLIKGLDPKKAIIEVHPNIDILPSNDDISFFEMEIFTNSKKFKKPMSLMKERLEGLRSEYDYILIDSPPSLGLT